MDPSMRMVFIAAVLMLALLAAIIGSVSADPLAWEHPNAHVASGPSHPL